MIARRWNEEAKDRPEFVSLYRELCVSEFEEMSSHLERLSLSGSFATAESGLHTDNDGALKQQLASALQQNAEKNRTYRHFSTTARGFSATHGLQGHTTRRSS